MVDALDMPSLRLSQAGPCGRLRSCQAIGAGLGLLSPKSLALYRQASKAGFTTLSQGISVLLIVSTMTRTVTYSLSTSYVLSVVALMLD